MTKEDLKETILSAIGNIIVFIPLCIFKFFVLCSKLDFIIRYKYYKARKIPYIIRGEKFRKTIKRVKRKS